MINEIFPDGAIAKDARLKVGDQILEVGGPKDTVTYDFHSITHSKAIAALRQLPAKVSVLFLFKCWKIMFLFEKIRNQPSILVCFR